MSNEQYGRGLCPFVGPSTDSKSPTSDPSASTWADKPSVLQLAIETDTYNTYKFIGDAWKKVSGPSSDSSDAGLSLTEDRPHQGTLAAPTLNSGVTSPNARINFDSVATPFSHCRISINETTSGNSVTALQADTATELVLPGIVTIIPASPIFTIGLLGVFRDPLIAGTPTASTANGTGTSEFGCISDSLDYSDGGTEVADRQMFWNFTSAAPNGVNMVKIIITPEIFLNQTAAADSPTVVSVRCLGYVFG